MTLEDKVKDALDKIRPQLQADGGDLEFVSMEAGGKVFVKLTGACGNCPMATMTLKQGVERFLKDTIPEVTEVLQTF
ncbi:NifU family protein [Treponema brennaborense]|uniref:Nitrogen-fixing NifU domain-containing protein n=1 Tax=Treponema brennaborense (strain DSM 12168 / CIP 105900 / DD5/3) TaxID=906968 RepID=F4LLY7_TREBD|nr:NifU family protein [Treponema brennaborense]AEE15679.1 nitrogen-fixing NifU domain-containing protein [Treponema brennaborense DSM 12168]